MARQTSLSAARLTKTSIRGLPAAVRFLALALLVGGAFGGGANLLLFDDFWVWPMPDLAYRFLAAAAFAYVAGAAVALLRRDWPPQELLMATVVTYGLPLVFAVALSHDDIRWTAGITWAFLGIVTVALAICAAWLPSNFRRPSPRDLGAPAAVVLLLLGLTVTAAGAAVFAVPRHSGWIWPWADLRAWTALDTRLIASMLLTIGVASLHTSWRRSKSAFAVLVAMLVAYAAVAAFGLAVHASKTPAFHTEDTLYIAIFSVVGAGTIRLALREIGWIGKIGRRNRP